MRDNDDSLIHIGTIVTSQDDGSHVDDEHDYYDGSNDAYAADDSNDV